MADTRTAAAIPTANITIWRRVNLAGDAGDVVEDPAAGGILNVDGLRPLKLEEGLAGAAAIHPSSVSPVSREWTPIDADVPLEGTSRPAVRLCRLSGSL